MNTEFDPYTFSSNVAFTGDPAIDAVIALAIVIGAAIILVRGISAYEEMRFTSYCFKTTLVLAAILFVVKMC